MNELELTKGMHMYKVQERQQFNGLQYNAPRRSGRNSQFMHNLTKRCLGRNRQNIQLALANRHGTWAELP